MIQADEVTKAASGFETRWTMLSLRRVNGALADALREQKELYHQATVSGTKRQQQEHAEALIRGYAAAISAMEAAGEADNTYSVGRHDGTVVIVGATKMPMGMLADKPDPSVKRVIVITADEIAFLFDTLPAFQKIADIKHLFPGAEVVEQEEI
jgi:hypothetical protein